MDFFAKGKRGNVYLCSGKEFNVNEKVVVKIFEREDRALNEAEFLMILNKFSIGPELFFYGDNFIVMEFCGGVPIKDYSFNPVDKSRIIKEVLLQCRQMDLLKINKLEMHKPLKHVIIGKKVWLIDFERCYYSEKPKNVSQFCEYLVRLFGYSREEIIKLVKNYKKDYSNESFDKILEFVENNL